MFHLSAWQASLPSKDLCCRLLHNPQGVRIWTESLCAQSETRSIRGLCRFPGIRFLSGGVLLNHWESTVETSLAKKTRAQCSLAGSTWDTHGECAYICQLLSCHNVHGLFPKGCLGQSEERCWTARVMRRLDSLMYTSMSWIMFWVFTGVDFWFCCMTTWYKTKNDCEHLWLTDAAELTHDKRSNLGPFTVAKSTSRRMNKKTGCFWKSYLWPKSGPVNKIHAQSMAVIEN